MLCQKSFTLGNITDDRSDAQQYDQKNVLSSEVNSFKTPVLMLECYLGDGDGHF